MMDGLATLTVVRSAIPLALSVAWQMMPASALLAMQIPTCLQEQTRHAFATMESMEHLGHVSIVTAIVSLAQLLETTSARLAKV
jgi:hypothetical protein